MLPGDPISQIFKAKVGIEEFKEDSEDHVKVIYKICEYKAKEATDFPNVSIEQIISNPKKKSLDHKVKGSIKNLSGAS